MLVALNTFLRMKTMNHRQLILMLCLSSIYAHASARVCEYLDTTVAKTTGMVAGGTGAGVLAGASAMELAGITAVAHSSSAWILTGSSGYIASTIGAVGTAGSVVAATPVVIGAGVVTGVALMGAGGVALYCHPRPVFRRVETFFVTQKDRVGMLLRR